MVWTSGSDPGKKQDMPSAIMPFLIFQRNMNTTISLNIRRIGIATLLGLAAMLFSSCDIFLEKPRHTLVEPKAVVPSRFLFSWDKDYNEWMDTPNRVYYHRTPLSQVLQNAPFTRLTYELYDMPEEEPLITIDSLGFTRRQILWVLCNDYNLKMSLRTLSDGKPESVIVRWRGGEVQKTQGAH